MANILYMIENKMALEHVDYKYISRDFGKQLNNIGNKLFLNAVYRYIDDGLNSIFICEVGEEHKLSEDKVLEYREKYDLAVWPVANFFNKDFIWQINAFAAIVEQLKMPFYFLGAGIQTDKSGNLDSLIEVIGESSKYFISKVLNYGGGFALRGYITKDFFEKLGFNNDNIIVTGCPSVYQNGKDFRIHRPSMRVSRDEFRFTVNGNSNLLRNPTVKKWFREYPNAVFLDQDEFIDILYNPYFFKEPANREIKNLLHRYKYIGLELVCTNRLFLIAEYMDWKNFFGIENINFSIGRRFHGNAIGICGGVPAMVLYHDSRTRELSDFFCIPSMDEAELKHKDIYDIYLGTDYTKFNHEYERNFNNFENALVDWKLVKNLNHIENISNKRYISEDFKVSVNQEFFKKILESRFYNSKLDASIINLAEFLAWKKSVLK